MLTEVDFTVVKRNGSLVPFRKQRIYRALEAAFRDTRKVPHWESLPEEVQSETLQMTEQVTQQLIAMASQGACLTVEGIQDLVEVTLMKAGHHDVARDYIVYRDQHKALREDSRQYLKVQREDGTITKLSPMRIASWIEEAFRRTHRVEGPTTSQIIEAVNLLTQMVMSRIAEKTLTLSTIQDEIERELMHAGFYEAAKDFILWRAKPGEQPLVVDGPAKGRSSERSRALLEERIRFACRGLPDISPDELLQAAIANFYEGIQESEIDLATILATRSKIEIEPAYSKVATRLLLDTLYRETIGATACDPKLPHKHQAYFKKTLQRAAALERLDPALLAFDLDLLAKAIDLQRDEAFTYLGLQTLYDRYFIHHEQKRLETPQIFWMRVAMGLALCEGEAKNARAIEFYNALSQFLFVSSTPTLFNAGTRHPQLSSCYLSTVSDDLGHIFKVISDNAQLSKWAGGIGNDWTNVRATGAAIQGTNGKSQGVIPFLKVANDTAVAVNQGGKRKGATCAYLEVWHLDIEDFLELRKNTGDDRRRTHDMNTANWIPDLFMKRIEQSGTWTLFSPSEVPDLHHLYGQAFEKRYEEYEQWADAGRLKNFKKVEALQLWRKMLSMLFETGHPWLTFKDPSNIRSPQDHAGVVHSSNLCTEILLNTSDKETAVCNLGSINLSAHMTAKQLDEEKLSATIRTAVRMLDNVIDINFYPTQEARHANLRHRPIGLGIMGFQDALYQQDISFASHEAVAFADRSMELISYHTVLASSQLAKERGTYPSYEGSKWARGLLPLDTLALLEKERGGWLDVDRGEALDWSPVRTSIREHGMRNSNTMAIAPTATISNITGVTQSIEPTYKHLYVKSNLSGEFTVPNLYLVEKLKAMGLWDRQMLDDLKYYDGSIVEIDRIPGEVKQLFLTAFEIDPEWLIECASRRQKWIDMGQSLNLYLAEPSGKRLDQMYRFAWLKGLKTTYYLRALAATQIEKSTTDINSRGIQPRWMKHKSASSNIQVDRGSCTLQEGCESCQ